VNKSVWIAIGWVLLIEGSMPFLFPVEWRNTLSRILRFSDGQIRFVGLCALLCGVATLELVHLFLN
jgi:hypothetical protein